MPALIGEPCSAAPLPYAPGEVVREGVAPSLALPRALGRDVERVARRDRGCMGVPGHGFIWGGNVEGDEAGLEHLWGC